MITKETRPLPCKLTIEEVAEKTNELVQLTANISRIDEMEENYKTEIRLARAHNAEQSKAVRKVLSKMVDIRPVSCEWRPFPAKGHFEVVRLDTGKVVERVPMTAAQIEACTVAPTLPLQAPADDGLNHAEVLEALG